MARVSKSIASAYFQAEGTREARRRPLERRVQASPHARLRREPPDPQDALAAVGLQVGPADEAVADEERQHVVAVHALVLAFVDLDQVVEAEEAADERTVPHQVVEGGEEDGRGRRAVELGPGRDVDGSAAVVDLEPAE